ncbi:MAG TPA: DUF2807 domain-containing protein, partial [Aquaticitalea sp.]|nr:DUF2807 domain-containing protein [Aquaticitalea sp.]
MRLTVVFIVLFVTHFVMSAQNSLEKNVGTFDEVKVYDLIEVNLVKSNENKVVISGNEADNVEIINKNNKLKIRMKLDKIFKGESTFVTVYYSALKTIDGNEGSLIISNETIDQDYIELKAQEGARLKINANVNKLNIRAVSGGIVEVSGKGNAQDIVLNTGGIY